MKISDRTYIIILIIMILGLSLVTYWRFQRARDFEVSVDWPEFEIPSYDWDELLNQQPDLDSFFSQKKDNDLETFFRVETEEKDWLSPDNKLKLTYPAGWMTMDKIVSEYVDDPGVILEDAKILLFALRFDMTEQLSALLTVSSVDKEKDLQKIKEGISQKVQEDGGETEITILSFEDKIAWLEVLSRYPDKPASYSKGTIIFSEEETYLVFFTASQRDWMQLKEEAESIFDSIELLE